MMKSTAIADFKPGVQSAGKDVSPRSPGALLIALGFAIFFLVLRSRQYTAVDGALRCLTVFHDSSLKLHGNNHMLYPFWMWLWNHAARSIGLGSSDWLGFVGLCQALNAVCAAAGIGMLFTVLNTIAGSRYALLGSLQYGLATAVVLHATNSAEPVVGLLFALTALALLAPSLRSDSSWRLFVVGILLTLALASYEIMAFVAPMVAFACVCWPGTKWRRAVTRLLAVGAGGALSLLPVYYTAYRLQGVPANRMVARFFVNDAGDFYSGFKFYKLVNPPYGLIRNLFSGVPDNYGGVRSLLKAPHSAFWIAETTVSLLLLGALGWVIAAGIARGIRASSISKWLLWSGVALSLLVVFVPIFYGGPLYDKFWLLPLAALGIAAAFAFRFSAGNPRRRLLSWAMAALVIVEAAVNVPSAVRDHTRETAHLKEASQLAATVTDRDSVVLDFDDVSMLWLAIWGHDKNTLVLADSKKTEATQWLADARNRTTANDGSLVFVGVLDHDRASWNDFVGAISGVPYEQFDCYRQNAVIISQYGKPGEITTIRRLRPPFACSF